MKKHIVKEPAPVLRTPAAEIPVNDISSPGIQKIIKEMSDTLRATPDGIGIAAPQIGYGLRMFLASEEALRWPETKKMDETELEKQKDHWEYYVFINPIITKTSQKKVHEEEGCLSTPGTYGVTERAEKVTIEAYDEHGKKFSRGTSSLYARVMQHETDHLNGVLFIDKAKNIKRITRNT